MHPFVLCVHSEIVDRAQKELNIEKQIKKIEDTWSVLALVFTPLPDSDVTALQVCCCLRVCWRCRSTLEAVTVTLCVMASGVFNPEHVLYRRIHTQLLSPSPPPVCRSTTPSWRPWRTTTCSCKT